ncbi:helix-turn-helix transcriptional regulator [Bradyrhizobium sp. U87765 SZCCT0131]|uniref:winged helix-turn-helix transcriptional regulator n=1 Tax=unclassified Bradyrhizobium TaxID=2631580 RepID=UPI001BA87E3C|nr:MULTISPECIES: helix-turn-helix domain-containing protein [unclassified Bradyrhizobium]MBR1223073.1 helix-turn-helix transcriptional regulator [Bradyrhizobium sp. U87765 SZCCT0131]MBR1265857.1 helix-turn-helix transcriptional regulator [Bradyrhizobium sp. U87765 SZCCT0134]MBR1308719.1 helix-turn-helix transcriptional regulator [Bradyrhizobium sp. U87765 SZCCT0110]MBR1318591.1 helix-turn-helix transcriptional regulator [Bradyrhizobium sp. U87765 SZCCT0109]MBR1352295.1 helix-turn-helix transcr
MVKRTSFETAECPIARSLDVIGDGWSLLIIRDALAGKRRFSEFQKSLGTAKNILAARLRTLVAQGIFELKAAADGGPHQEYVLTDKGKDLFPVMVALRQWADVHLFRPGEIFTQLVDRKNGRPLQPLELRADDGRVLQRQDIAMVRSD